MHDGNLFSPSVSEWPKTSEATLQMRSQSDKNGQGPPVSLLCWGCEFALHRDALIPGSAHQLP